MVEPDKIKSPKELKEFLNKIGRLKRERYRFSFQIFYTDEREVRPQSGYISRFDKSKDKKVAQIILKSRGTRWPLSGVLTGNVLLYLTDEGWKENKIQKIVITYEK